MIVALSVLNQQQWSKKTVTGSAEWSTEPVLYRQGQGQYHDLERTLGPINEPTSHQSSLSVERIERT